MEKSELLDYAQGYINFHELPVTDIRIVGDRVVVEVTGIGLWSGVASSVDEMSTVLSDLRREIDASS